MATLSCAKSKSPMHIFFPTQLCAATFACPLLGPQLTSHMKGETNALKLPNKFDKKKLIQCKCLVRDNEFVISQSFRR